MPLVCMFENHLKKESRCSPPNASIFGMNRTVTSDFTIATILRLAEDNAYCKIISEPTELTQRLESFLDRFGRHVHLDFRAIEVVKMASGISTQKYVAKQRFQDLGFRTAKPQVDAAASKLRECLLSIAKQQFQVAL